MSDTPPPEQTEMTAEGYEACITKEFEIMIETYNEFTLQCRRLAAAMHYEDDYLLSKIWPKKAAERTDTLRLILWFADELKVAVDHRMKVDRVNRREAAEKAALIARVNARGALLKRLQLTQEQCDLLGIRVILSDDQPQ